jgi:alpha-L-rhamnosidase
LYRRAPFIWTARQETDALALWRVFFGGAKRRDEGTNRWFLFRRRFELAARPDGARFTFTVDGRYHLFVNGARVGRGPVRCDPLHQRTDTYDLTEQLVAGTNVLALLIRVDGADTSWYQCVQGHWQPVFGDGALYCDGSVRCGDATIEVLSDESWRCLECDAWQRDTPRSAWGLGFIEVHDANRLPRGWTAPEFDDSAWDPVRVLSAGGGPPDGIMGGMKIEPFPTLIPREIPFLRESPLFPERVVRCYGVVPSPQLPLEDRLYREELVESTDDLVTDPDTLLASEDSVAVVRTRADRDVSLLLDFGRIHTGHPFFEIEAFGGEVIDLAVAESIPGEWETEPPSMPRIDPERGHGKHLLRYLARPGHQRFERFEWTAVRYLQLTVRNAPRGLQVRRLGSLYTRYPAEERGAFECSDALLNRLWQVGRYTLQLCMHDGWEDCPSREQRQWLGDATVEFLVAQAAFGPSANALNRQFLLQAAESQRPDGLTQMFAPGDHHTDAVVIPDWTLQWILNAEMHWLYTGDLETVAEIFPAIQRALAWFERQRGPHGLVTDLPYWHFMDWAALGRHGEAAALNAELVGALRGAARLATALQSPRVAARYRDMASQIAAGINQRHWDARRGVYVDVVDPASGQRDPRVSQHANGAAILWGIAPAERWGSMIQRITDPQRLVFTAAPPIVPKGEPFDAEESVVLANTFYSHFVYRALAEAGRFERALALIRDRYGRMLARGATTLWESFDPTASLCHGFSATPVYQLSTEILGVYPLAPGFERFRVAVQPGDLEYARGVFPTVRGDIQVSWERREGRIELELNVPEGTRALVTSPITDAPPAGASEFSPGRHHVRIPRQS